MTTENEFTRNGMRFVAVEGDDCSKCYFESKCISDIHPCMTMGRTDRMDIVWTRVSVDYHAD
jgi:hypothetical protein